jgi:predicted AlkP superfamily pyrophosphatase or phosphodiesterase
MLPAGSSPLRYAAFLLSLVLSFPTALASAQAAKPKLVVVLVVDQMRADYLVRYGGLFEKGLKRLTTEGAWFTNAAYPYMSTLTCVGHTTIGTGTLPWRHGIIQNAWYDRATGKSVTCTADENTTEISYGALTGAGDSAHLMMAPSLAETMKKQTQARVVTISLKARSAIGLAGHDADAVIWLDDRGAWQTSSAFAKEPLGWVGGFIKANPIDRDAGKSWDRTLPVERYQGSDELPGERGSSGWTALFPHPLGAAGDRAFYAHWTVSPFADEYLEQFAESAIDALHLGKGDGIDFLGVSFSTLDLIGHAYGPRSHEVQDELVRLDRTLGRLLDALDEKVGAGNYVLALSADHGVADVPEQSEGGGRILSTVVSGSIDAVLKGASYGEGPFVAAVAGSDIYLKPGVYDRLHADPRTVKALIDAMGKLSGVARVLTADDVSSPAARESKDPQIRAAALSYFAGRSGDLIVIPKENWIVGAIVTTHGTLNAYDQRVPVVLFGAGIRPGTLADAARPSDIAPTLAKLVGVTLEPVDGKVLTPALKK